jgi:hypothetical protein
MDKGSQHREQFAPLIRSLELYCQRHYLLVQHIAKLSHQAYACLGRLSMVDLQPTTSGADGCPDILACETLAHRPSLVQQRDLALCCDQTQKMYPTCRERHLARQQSDLLRSQTPPCDVLVCLAWRCSLLRRWMVALGIKPHELWCCPSHLCQSVEAMRAPERLVLQSMQPLYTAIICKTVS